MKATFEIDTLVWLEFYTRIYKEGDDRLEYILQKVIGEHIHDYQAADYRAFARETGDFGMKGAALILADWLEQEASRA